MNNVMVHIDIRYFHSKVCQKQRQDNLLVLLNPGIVSRWKMTPKLSLPNARKATSWLVLN